MKTLVLTALAIVAFAANSLLTRRALAGSEIQAAQFVAIRVMSGALMLALLAARRKRAILPRREDVAGVASLLTYAVAFTYAYIRLGAAIGALILFPTVQLTIVMIASFRGTQPSGREALGTVVSLVGILWLLAPNGPAPSLPAALLMVLAGSAWGIYTLLGRGVADPLARTARNFIGAAPFAFTVVLISPAPIPSASGIGLAIVSGAITSALGYVVWYAALPRLTAAAAGAAQLMVPALTALVGMAWLGERPSLRLVASSSLILGGVWLVMSRARTRATV